MSTITINGGWIGVDLDGTLAHYEKWIGIDHIGEPIPLMAERVRKWLAEGKDVRIFTARVFGPRQGRDVEITRKYIEDWCVKHFGVKMQVTCQKDFGLIQLWDDRCVQVIPNTGQRADGNP